MTPYSTRTLDRWGNLINYQEGGYEFVNNQPVYAPNRLFRSYLYDDNNQLITESLGTHGYVSSSGVSTSAQIYRLLFRDVVKEVDEAREPQTEALISSRTRRKQYNSVGQLTAEIDATERKVEYAYNIHGDRLATRNARGTVFFEFYDRNGSVRFQGVLRTSSAAGFGEYNSFAGTGTIFHTYLHEYLYDQANRRFASKTFTFTEIANAPWSYTWLDGRNFGIIHRDEMGVVTQCRYDQFGNKAVEIDGAGARKEWNATIVEFVAGRIETYTQPIDNGPKFGRYTYNRLGELAVDALGNARTEYEYHQNGQVYIVTITPDTTALNVRQVTTSYYDARGQLTSEGRFGPDSNQAKYISYDNQGRLARVEDNTIPFRPDSDVRYSYDEWGNIRRTQAAYTQTWGGQPRASDSWCAYDDAGRITISNGAMSGGVIRLRTPGSVHIDYDSVGRRSETTEYVRKNAKSNPDDGGTWTWETMRDERYEYEDLGHLRKTEQRVRHVKIVRNLNGFPDQVGSWQMLSSRSSNLRGDVTHAEQWRRISGPLDNISVDQVAAHTGTTTNAYRADGRLVSTRTVADDPTKSTLIVNAYDAQTGQLSSYEFTAHRSDLTPFTAKFTYSHTLQNGNRVVWRISDAHLGLHTTKTYDPLGRLSRERVDLQNPDPSHSGSDRYEERLYEYGAQGRIIFKDIRLRLSSNGPDTVPLPTPSTGQQVHVSAGNRTIATVGNNRLAGATKFDFAYTPMSEAGISGTSRYVVQSGDALIDIAQAIYGDGALWYIIADANSIAAEPDDPLPASEVGKAYEVPNVIRSTNSASTFKPYDAAEIIGNDRPIAIPPPPPPKYSEIEQMLVASVSISIQIGATVVLSYVGVPVPLSAAIGAGLSNLAGQGTAWGLGMQAPGQQGIDWDNVGIAAVEGFMSSAGPYGVLGREFLQQGKNGFEGWTRGPGLNWSGIAGSLFNVGFDALSPVLGGPAFGPERDGRRAFNFSLGGFINSAYNPSSGWAIPGSGKTPMVGAFGYAYNAVANGLANMGYNWIRDQLERPSAPAKAASARWTQTKFEGAATDIFEGAATEITEVVVNGRRYSAEVAPSTGQLVVVIDGRRYWGEVDRSTGQMLWLEPYDAMMGQTLSVRRGNEDAAQQVSVAEQEPVLQRFWTAMAMADAKKVAEAAAAALVRDHGPRLAKLQKTIDFYQKTKSDKWTDGAAEMLAREYSMAAEEQQRLIDLYAPPQSCVAPIPAPVNPPALPPLPPTPANSAALPALPSIPSVYLDPRSVLTQAEVYSYPRPLAANILPQRPQPFGAWGNADFHEHSLRSSVEHAYAYEGYVTGVQATNDLDRIARAAGIKRIFVGSGIHRNAVGKVVLDADLVTNDKIAAADVMKRHKDKGLRISVLDLGDPIDERLFNELQAAAAKGAPYEFVKNSKPLLALRASSFATLAAHCYGAPCLPQGPRGEPTPTYFVTSDPELRTVVDVPEGAASTHYALAGLNIASGALSIYAGIRHDNDALAALGITGGTAQIAGGASWIYGVSRQSVTAISFGSKASLLGGLLTAPLTLYDVYRDFGAPGEHASRSWQESAYTGIVDVGKLAGIYYPPAAFAAIGAEYVVKPVAEKASEYATPKFIGAMSQAYGIPEQYLWSWH